MKLVRYFALIALSSALVNAATQLNFSLILDQESLAQEQVIVTLNDSASFGTTDGLKVTATLVEETEDNARFNFVVSKDADVVCESEITAEYNKEAVILCQGPTNYELHVVVAKVETTEAAPAEETEGIIAKVKHAIVGE